MEASDDATRPRPAHAGFPLGLAIAALLLHGCAVYQELIQHGGSLPLGESGAAWSPGVTTPSGGAVGVQIIRRF